LIYATSSATVPKQTVVVRKAYGAGIYAMGGPAYDPESVIGLPSGEIAIMGPEAAINAVYARKLAEIDDPEERQRMEERLREEYREDIDIHRMASDVVIDELVPPSRLREELAARFDFYADVEKSLPDKNTGRSSDTDCHHCVLARPHSGSQVRRNRRTVVRTSGIDRLEPDGIRRTARGLRRSRCLRGREGASL